MRAVSEGISRFGRYDIFECENCGEQEKCKSMGYMTSSPVDSDRDCCDRPSYEKADEESAYTLTQLRQVLDDDLMKRIENSLNSKTEE